jgi:hypothetical protein
MRQEYSSLVQQLDRLPPPSDVFNHMRGCSDKPRRPPCPGPQTRGPEAPHPRCQVPFYQFANRNPESSGRHRIE